MNDSPVFTQFLQTSLDGFVWAIQQTPPDRFIAHPPKGLGDWSVTQHVFHMVYYEQFCAVPSIKQWLGGPLYDDSTYDEDGAWATNKARLDELIAQFRAVRAEQIAIMAQFTTDLWHKVGDSVWGRQTPYWIVSKTWQHTNEHTNDIMRIVLFWDSYMTHEAESVTSD